MNRSLAKKKAENCWMTFSIFRNFAVLCDMKPALGDGAPEAGSWHTCSFSLSLVSNLQTLMSVRRRLASMLTLAKT